MSGLRDPTRALQVLAVFRAATEMIPDERAGYLEAACGPDALLRAEVAELLANYDRDDDFLETPAAALHGLVPMHPAATIRLGQRLGAYEILTTLGEGGMGVVYGARRADGQFEQTVAIKVAKPAAGLSREELARRLRRERQILANLDHPNIARLLDGGTTEDGLPYVVMGYIDGQPITAYCDDRQLTISERLRLFHTVCLAIQYAHEHGVIHRDLKPTNILVRPDGVPVVLDFGIAAALTPEAARSLHLTLTPDGPQPLTPAYASPEQMRNQPATAAADIYALGLILYELLTGHSAHQVTSNHLPELRQVICETIPPLPSTMIGRVADVPGPDGTMCHLTPDQVSRTREGTPARLRRRLTGDLDRIVLMALHKEPAQRYATAAALADDLTRHLDGRPVRAHPRTLVARIARALQRYGLLAVILLVAALGLVGVLSLLGWLGLGTLPPAAGASQLASERPAASPPATADTSPRSTPGEPAVPLPALRVTPPRLALGQDDLRGVVTLTADGMGEFQWEAVADPMVARWLTLEPTAGIIRAGEQQSVTIRVDRTRLEPGDFQGQAVVRTVVAGTEVTATVTVLGRQPAAPRLRLEPADRLDFGFGTAARSVIISLDGSGEVPWNATIVGDGFAVSPAAGVIKAGELRALAVTFDRAALTRHDAALGSAEGVRAAAGRLVISGQAGQHEQQVTIELLGQYAVGGAAVRSGTPVPGAAGAGAGDPEPAVTPNHQTIRVDQRGQFIVTEVTEARFQWYVVQAPSWLTLEAEGQRLQPDPENQYPDRRVLTEAAGTVVTVIPDWEGLGTLPREGLLVVKNSANRHPVTITARFVPSSRVVTLEVTSRG